MRFDVITLFPELFTPFFSSGVTRRAYQLGLVEVKLWNLRDFAQGAYHRVDDRPFGGGAGMVMLAEPLMCCLEQIRLERQPQEDVPAPVVLFSPIGAPINHATVQTWTSSPGAILVCGRYEGVDQRFIDTCVDRQISLGDFVLSGGEIPALALLDAVARLQPGVLHDPQSHELDSFNPAVAGLLDCPHYTRPETWRGHAVPSVLLSGNHAHIARWQHEQRLLLTHQHRPELLQTARQSGGLSAKDEVFLKNLLPE